MKNIFESKVYYSDTDAYGVVWHGSYLRWMEAGRIELCESMGHNLVELQEKDITLPVVNLNVRYKSAAKLNDEVIIETSIKKYNPLSVTFEQKIYTKADKRLCISAEVTVVAVSNAGKLYRKMPDILVEMFEKALK